MIRSAHSCRSRKDFVNFMTNLEGGLFDGKLDIHASRDTQAVVQWFRVLNNRMKIDFEIFHKPT